MEDIVAFMVPRANPDVAATLGWLDSEAFEVVRWHETLPAVITWIEEEDRTVALEGAKEAWRVHVRQYWATFDPKSGR